MRCTLLLAKNPHCHCLEQQRASEQPELLSMTNLRDRQREQCVCAPFGRHSIWAPFFSKPIQVLLSQKQRKVSFFLSLFEIEQTTCASGQLNCNWRSEIKQLSIAHAACGLSFSSRAQSSLVAATKPPQVAAAAPVEKRALAENLTHLVWIPPNASVPD